MEKHSTFGECLTAILHALDLKCTKLAREINVDPSLIYRWLREERVPSFDTPYVELISNYLAGKITDHHFEEVVELIGKRGMKAPDDLSDTIRIWLQEAQAYSLKQQKKAKMNRDKGDGNTSIASFLKHIDAKKSARASDVKSNFDHETAMNGDLHACNDNVQVIKGHKEVILSIIKLLKQAHRVPESSQDKILLTFNTEIILDEELHARCTRALYDALSYGWRIILQVKLNNNIHRTMKVIENMQILLSKGNFDVYYSMFDDPAPIFSEVCVIPHVGAMLCLCSKIGKQVDRAFWYHEKDSIDMLSTYFFQHLTLTKPLLKSYPSQETAEFQQAVAEAEAALGDRYIFKNGLSTITIPLDLYEKYIKQGKGTSQEVSYRKFLHRKRIESFETQVKHYEFKEICFIESLERLVKARKYSFDEYYILGDTVPDTEDIVCHLENAINMLKKYDNYEIAFVSKKAFNNLSNIFWLVKGNLSVLIETLNIGKKVFDNKRVNAEKNFIITEKSIVNAFHDYFLKLWSDIPDENKSKRNAIQVLQHFIEVCKANDR